jgi:hypothetical protein
MTESFLIVVAPWIIFGVCLALLCIRLLRARRPGERSPRPPRRHDEKPNRSKMRREKAGRQ